MSAVNAHRRHSTLAIRALACSVALAVTAQPALAHPIHTTLTVLTTDVSGHTLTLNIRAFADDFSATVARFAGRPAPRDSSILSDEVTHYVRAQFAFTSNRGAPIVLQPCGVTRAREVYLLCFRITAAEGVRGASFVNRMLTELHPDQVNIVQLEAPSARRSFLFTKGSAASTLP